MLRQLIPHVEQIRQHPMYRIEARHLHRRELSLLQRYSLWWFVCIAALLVGFWGVFVVMRLLQYGSGGAGNVGSFSTGSHPLASSTSAEIAGWAFVASIGVVILLDFISMVVSVNSISKEKTTGNWDLILMTNLSRMGIVRTKHTLSQIRAWRITIILVSFRLAVCLLVVLHMFLLPDEFTGELLITDYVRELIERPFQTFFGTTLTVIFAFTYVVEPLWRMRAVTAMGTSISARNWSVTTSMMIGLAAILGMWISQAAIIAGYFWFSSIFTTSSIFLGMYSEIVEYVVIFLWVTVAAFIIYAYYRWLREWNLQNAARIAFRI